MQPDSALGVAAALASDFHYREVVMITEVNAILKPSSSGAERQAEHATVETLCALAVRHPQHHMPQRPDLHVFTSCGYWYFKHHITDWQCIPQPAEQSIARVFSKT
jgi:hypothetical protein